MIGDRVALVGCGLIGGSFLLALREAGVAGRAVGCDNLPQALEEARRRGIVDEIAASPAEAARGASLIVLAVPVGATQAVCESIAPALAPDALVTDVGSTKADVLAAVARALPFPERFVAAHPLAGTERSGPGAADPGLFRGKRCILTPQACTAPRALAEVRGLWEKVGCTVEEMEPAAHDRAMAWVSHLPHLSAFALAAAIGSASSQEKLGGLWGGGFLDTTRIASSDPVMWRDVFLANREALAVALERLDEELGNLKRAMATGDAEELEAIIRRARAGRAAILEARQ